MAQCHQNQLEVLSKTIILYTEMLGTQVDNQVFEAQSPVVLYVTPPSRSTDPEEVARPALQITGERVPRTHSSNAEIIKVLLFQCFIKTYNEPINGLPIQH